MRPKSTFLALLVVLLCPSASGQWVQTNGPYASLVTALTGSGRFLFAATGYNGVYVSTDSGGTWAAASSGLEYTYGLASHVPSVLALQVVGSNVFAGTHFAGVYRSTDWGANWTQVNSGLTDTNVDGLFAAGSLLYAITSSGGVFYTSDNGNRWTACGPGLPTGTYVYCLAANGSNLYAGTSRGVYVSTDIVAGWTAASTGLDGFRMVFSIAAMGQYLFAGTYCCGVYVSTDGGGSWSQANSEFKAMSVHDLLLSGDSLYVGTWGEGVFLTTDRGASWVPVNNGLTDGKVDFLARYGGRVFAKGELGLYVSQDMGRTWAVSPSPAVSVTSIEAFLSDGSRLYTVAARNNVFMTTDYGVTWTWKGRPSADFHAYCLALAGQTLLLGGTCTEGRVERSTDEGVTWISALDTIGAPYAGRFNAEALAVHGSQILAGGTGVWRSTDEGVNWKSINPGSSLRYIWTLALTDSFAFAGGSSGVYLLRGSDTSWIFAGTGLPASNTVKCLAVKGSTLIAGTWGRGLFRSTDYGTIWQPVNGGLSDSVVLSLAVAGSTILAGTHEQGVFVSTDDGISWAGANYGLTGRMINALSVHGTYAFAGTGDENGVWRRPLSNFVAGDEVVDVPVAYWLEQNYPNPFNSSTTIRYGLPNKTGVQLSVFNTLGQQIAQLVNGDMEAGYHEVKFDGSGLASGVYFYRLRAGEFMEIKRLMLLK